MKCRILTYARASAGLLLGVVLGCSKPEVPSPSPSPGTTSGHRDADVNESKEAGVLDAARAAPEEEDDDVAPPNKHADAARDAGAKPKNVADAGDAGKSDGGGASDAGKAGDAGDDAGDAGAPKCVHSDAPNDVRECDQFASEDCDARAVDVCQGFHAMMDANVFSAFVECVADTPGLDLCGEDQSAIAECEAEARAKACKTHQAACEAYEGCETMSADECDEAVRPFNDATLAYAEAYFECGSDPMAYLDL